MKIVLADDHTIVRDALIRVLQEAFPLAEITGVENAASLLAAVQHQKWDVVITDITMPPGDSGLTAVKDIHDAFPMMPVIVMSMHSAEQYALRAFRSGARGFLTKDAASEELVKAVNTVLSGRKYIRPEVSELLADALVHDGTPASHDLLSNREMEVMKMLADGKTVADIAAILSLSNNTVSTFRQRIFEKMNFNNDMELIKYVVDHKLLDN
jgi:two-component system invasion response regulator UvrY